MPLISFPKAWKRQFFLIIIYSLRMVSRERVCLFFISFNLFIHFYIVGYCEEVISHISQISSGHNQPAAARRIKQSIAKKSARFSAKLSSRHNRGGASHAPGSPFIYHIKPSIAKKSARLSDKFHQGIISPRRLAADRKLTNWLPSVIARFVLPGLE